MITVKVNNKISSNYTDIICLEDFQSIGRPYKNLNNKEKKECLEILKSEFIDGYLLN